MGFDKCGEVTAKYFLYPAQVRLAVAGNQFGALFVYIQSTIYTEQVWDKERKGERLLSDWW